MSRKGLDEDERLYNNSQGSTSGGMISLICITLLAMQSVNLINGMFNGSNDIIKK
jgi:hypothetical protein